MNARFLSSILEIDSAKWDKLVPQNYPFAKHGFLAALEKSGCVGGNSGWSPQHLLIEEGSDLIAAIPAYQKSHSYGEYVFDSQWAGAFERYGKQYYPKLLTAIPFTPATGPRILTKPETHLETVWPVMRNAIDIKPDSIYSSWHILFVDSATKTFLAKAPDILGREDIQFHWYNRVPATEDDSNKEDSTSRHFRHFDQFLAGFRSSKRKQIKRERRKVAEQNLTLIRRTGTEISEKHWEEFYHCYQMTYLKRSGHTGYLNKAFFQLIADTMANQCMLVSAYQQHNTEEKEERQHDLAACSLFFFDAALSRRKHILIIGSATKTLPALLMTFYSANANILRPIKNLPITTFLFVKTKKTKALISAYF